MAPPRAVVAGALLLVEAALASAILTREPGASLLIPSAVASVGLFCSMVVVATQAKLSESWRLPQRPGN